MKMMVDHNDEDNGDNDNDGLHAKRQLFNMSTKSIVNKYS